VLAKPVKSPSANFQHIMKLFNIKLKRNKMKNRAKLTLNGVTLKEVIKVKGNSKLKKRVGRLHIAAMIGVIQ